MKFSELPPDLQQRQLALIQEHGELLRQNAKDAVAVVNNYLLLALGGALAATLSLMGASSDIRNNPAAFLALTLFAIGLLLAGALAGANFEVSRMQFVHWARDADDFASDKTDHHVIFDNLNREISRYGWIPAALGYMAFACLVLGFAIALQGLAPHPASKPTTSQSSAADTSQKLASPSNLIPTPVPSGK